MKNVLILTICVISLLACKHTESNSSATKKIFIVYEKHGDPQIIDSIISSIGCGYLIPEWENVHEYSEGYSIDFQRQREICGHRTLVEYCETNGRLEGLVQSQANQMESHMDTLAQHIMNWIFDEKKLSKFIPSRISFELPLWKTCYSNENLLLVKNIFTIEYIPSHQSEVDELKNYFRKFYFPFENEFADKINTDSCQYIIVNCGGKHRRLEWLLHKDTEIKKFESFGGREIECDLRTQITLLTEFLIFSSEEVKCGYPTFIQ